MHPVRLVEKVTRSKLLRILHGEFTILTLGLFITQVIETSFAFMKMDNYLPLNIKFCVKRIFKSRYFYQPRDSSWYASLSRE